jgi:hypothetical protein
MRRVGVELELGGLELETVTAIERGYLGGVVRERGRYEMELSGDEAGPWSLELDFAWLKAISVK